MQLDFTINESTVWTIESVSILISDRKDHGTLSMVQTVLNEGIFMFVDFEP